MSFKFHGPDVLYADKDELVAKKLPLEIVKIDLDASGGFNGDPRWMIELRIAGRDNEFLTLGCNEKRDEELEAAQAALVAGEKLPKVRLVKSGRAYYFRDASA